MKVVFVSSMLPSGHFSQILTHALNIQKNVELVVYTDTDRKNLAIKGCGTIKPVWPRTALFIYTILKEVMRDRPDVVHIQQEFNMYGSIKTAVLFPFLILGLRLLGLRVAVTIHAAVFKHQVTPSFIHLFTAKESPLITPFTLTLFFSYIYRSISLFANVVICHTELMKTMLTKDWGVDIKKVRVIPTGIPQKRRYLGPKEPYFLYLGYMVRRNGLPYVIDGFAKLVRSYPTYRLVLAGGVIKGQEYAFEEIKEYIKKRGIKSRVEIRGFVEQKEQDELYKKAYAVVIPAKVSMGSSGRLYHAQSFGKCILTSNVGHFREDIRHMEDGILVDHDKWHTEFERIVKNPSLVKKIEDNVWKKAKTKSAGAIAKMHVEVYAKTQ